MALEESLSNRLDDWPRKHGVISSIPSPNTVAAVASQDEQEAVGGCKNIDDTATKYEHRLLVC